MPFVVRAVVATGDGDGEVLAPVIELGSRLETHSYVMNVIAWPGMMRMSRGVRPFQRALIPSSLAMSAMDDTKPPYLGAWPGITT